MSGFSIEPELNSPTPRRVGYRDGAKTGCGLWFIRLFLLPHTIIGIGFLSVAIGSTGLYVAVGLFGETYDGKVVKKETRKHKTGKTNYAHYVFTADGREHTGEVSISEAGFAEIRESDAITVRALEAWPERGNWPRVPGHSPLRDIGAMWLAALFWNGIMSVFLWGGVCAALAHPPACEIRAADAGDHSRRADARGQGNDLVPDDLRIRRAGERWSRRSSLHTENVEHAEGRVAGPERRSGDGALPSQQAVAEPRLSLLRLHGQMTGRYGSIFQTTILPS